MCKPSGRPISEAEKKLPERNLLRNNARERISEVVVGTVLAEFESLLVPQESKGTVYETGKNRLTENASELLTRKRFFQAFETKTAGLTACASAAIGVNLQGNRDVAETSIVGIPE